MRGISGSKRQRELVPREIGKKMGAGNRCLTIEMVVMATLGAMKHALHWYNGAAHASKSAYPL